MREIYYAFIGILRDEVTPSFPEQMKTSEPTCLTEEKRDT